MARRFPPGSDGAVGATVELLRRLAGTRFPAERLAHDEPVSVCGDRPVLVTEFVDGARAPGTARMYAAFGGLLGALHARPGDALPLGGGWHHLVAQGTPRDEIDAALALLHRADGGPHVLGPLHDALSGLDDCGDAPHGVVHPDFVPVNAIRPPEGGVVIVDWAGAGRGPRLWSLGFLLWAAGARELGLVDAVAGRYRTQLQLTPGELERLPGAIRARPRGARPAPPHHAARRPDRGPRPPGVRRARLASAHHSSRVAIAAPSAIDSNFAHVTLGTTTSWPTNVPNPQSEPAMTRSRPTTPA